MLSSGVKSTILGKMVNYSLDDLRSILGEKTWISSGKLDYILWEEAYDPLGKDFLYRRNSFFFLISVLITLQYINYICTSIATGFIPHIIPTLDAMDRPVSYRLWIGFCGWYRNCPAGWNVCLKIHPSDSSSARYPFHLLFSTYN